MIFNCKVRVWTRISYVIKRAIKHVINDYWGNENHRQSRNDSNESATYSRNSRCGEGGRALLKIQGHAKIDFESGKVNVPKSHYIYGPKPSEGRNFGVSFPHINKIPCQKSETDITNFFEPRKSTKEVVDLKSGKIQRSFNTVVSYEDYIENAKKEVFPRKWNWKRLSTKFMRNSRTNRNTIRPSCEWLQPHLCLSEWEK